MAAVLVDAEAYRRLAGQAVLGAALEIIEVDFARFCNLDTDQSEEGDTHAG